MRAIRSPAPPRLLLVLLATSALAGAAPALAQDAVPEPSLQAPATAPPALPTPPAGEDQIAFSADTLDYDSNADIVKVSGSVVMRRDGYTLNADAVTWNRATGEVVAEGAVRTVGPQGDIAYGDRIVLTDTLRDGVVDNLLVVMADGGRIAARRGTRVAGVYNLELAAYTPCAVETPQGCPKEPSWQVKALRVIYDPARRRVTYEGARVELFGLPVIPLPGLSHPVGGGGGNGFTVPDIRYSAANGLEYEQPYYWRLAPNRDLTVAAHVYTGTYPMVRATFRTLEDKGAFQVTGYGTFGSRATDLFAPVPGSTSDFRGYIDANGRHQFDANWSVTGSLRLASDRTFLRRYDISHDDRLRSTIAVERIDRDSYLSVAGWAVQTMRIGDDQGLVPLALPEIDYRRRIADPLLGGVIQLQANSLAIGRSDGQDTQRAFVSARWDLRRLTTLGHEVTFTLYGRGDVYNSRQNDLTSTIIYRGDAGWQTRGIAAAAVDLRWPFAGDALGGSLLITPRVQIVAAPRIANLSVPNEDARAVDLEDSNLFALNRFPGYDRFEDSSRVTYGLETAIRRDDLSIESIIGQSYRLTNRSSIFPDGTGLSERMSDIVGRTDVRFRDFVKLTHRFRLDKDNFAVRRNEFDATVGSKATYALIGYLRLNRNITPAVEDLRDREEVQLAGRVQVARYWSVFGSTIIDLTDATEDPLALADGYEPVRHRLGVAYDDDCLSIGLTWRRDYRPTGDAKSGNSFLIRLALRNLGG